MQQSSVADIHPPPELNSDIIELISQSLANQHRLVEESLQAAKREAHAQDLELASQIADIKQAVLQLHGDMLSFFTEQQTSGCVKVTPQNTGDSSSSCSANSMGSLMNHCDGDITRVDTFNRLLFDTTTVVCEPPTGDQGDFVGSDASSQHAHAPCLAPPQNYACSSKNFQGETVEDERQSNHSKGSKSSLSSSRSRTSDLQRLDALATQELFEKCGLVVRASQSQRSGACRVKKNGKRQVEETSARGSSAEQQSTQQVYQHPESHKSKFQSDCMAERTSFHSICSTGSRSSPWRAKASDLRDLDARMSKRLLEERGLVRRSKRHNRRDVSNQPSDVFDAPKDAGEVIADSRTCREKPIDSPKPYCIGTAEGGINDASSQGIIPKAAKSKPATQSQQTASQSSHDFAPLFPHQVPQDVAQQGPDALKSDQQHQGCQNHGQQDAADDHDSSKAHVKFDDLVERIPMVTKREPPEHNSNHYGEKSPVARSQSMFGASSQVERLRLQTESSIVQHISVQPDTDEDPKRSLDGTWFLHPSCLFYVFGMVDWSNGWTSFVYRKCILLLLMAVSVISAYACVVSELPVHESMSTAVISLGSCLALCTLHMGEAESVLRPQDGVLWNYATDQELHRDWRIALTLPCIELLVFTACMLFSKVLFFSTSECHETALSETLGTWRILDLVCFMVALGYMMMIAYCHMHVCSALRAGIGQFCQMFYENKSVDEGIREWNVLQTILRQASRSMDGCLCMLGTLLLAQFLFTGIWMLQRPDELQLVYSNTKCCAMWVGWMVPPWVLLLFVTFQAADVTAQCARVPSLINSWLCKEDGLLMVEYIANSAAGFYIQGVRITPYMAMKITYIAGAIAFTVVTKSMLQF